MGSSSDVNSKYPWPRQSNVNVTDFITVKPWLRERHRTNFNIWKEQMLCLVESQGLLGFIDGEILPPEISAANSDLELEQKLWRRADRLVKGWILGSIGKDALDAVWKLQTAREVWLGLEKRFSQQIQPNQISRSSGYFSRYFPLYKAALEGDWETAKYFFDNDNEAATAIITSASETALHPAVATGKSNDIVKKLVELMPHDSLAIRNVHGLTALHGAAMVGNIEAAIALVNKNPALLNILNNSNDLPVQLAAGYCHKDTLEYLIACMSKPNVEQNLLEGQHGIKLLNSVIASEFIDVAWDLAEKYPILTRSNHKGRCALSIIAETDTVFASRESFSWWQKLIYDRIPIKQSQRKAAQSTYVASDIENGSCNVYKKYSSSFRIICGVSQKLHSTICKVVERLVPQVKDFRNKKAVHQETLELAKYLCQQMVSLPQNEALTMFRDSIIRATKHGISEMVEVILETYPLVAFDRDETGRNVILLAASYRFENVFNLIYNMNDRKNLFFDSVDYQGNNLMHQCAKLAPPDRLNLIPGAALQMQRELQWFKEAQKFVHPSRRIWSNKQNETPQMLFTKEHRQLKAEGERWMKDAANACTIAAALIATVVFAAAFTVPGGVQTETGIPIFWDQFAFILFAISDGFSLFTSITSLLMFLSILTSRYAEEDFLYVLPKRLCIGLLSLFISITFMLAAFSATLYLVFRRRVAWFLIPVAAFACLPVTSFVLLQFPLLVEVIYSTYGPGIFGKKSDVVLY